MQVDAVEKRPGNLLSVTADLSIRAGTFPLRISKVSAGTWIHRRYQDKIRRYGQKISGPLLDRIDLHVSVMRPKYSELTATIQGEPSCDIAKRVAEARAVQAERLSRWHMQSNAQMGHRQLKETCQLDAEGTEMLRVVFEKLHLSARSYDRIIKVARTIADLAGSDQIRPEHVAEAISFRNMINGK